MSVAYAPLTHAEVKHYGNDTFAVLYSYGDLPSNVERTLFAALYFGLVGRG